MVSSSILCFLKSWQIRGATFEKEASFVISCRLSPLICPHVLHPELDLDLEDHHCGDGHADQYYALYIILTLIFVDAEDHDEQDSHNDHEDHDDHDQDRTKHSDCDLNDYLNDDTGVGEWEEETVI